MLVALSSVDVTRSGRANNLAQVNLGLYSEGSTVLCRTNSPFLRETNSIKVHEDGCTHEREIESEICFTTKKGSVSAR